MLLYSNATTDRGETGFHLEVDAKLVCDFLHVSKLAPRKKEGVIDAIEYYLEDSRGHRRTWGPFCTIDADVQTDIAAPGVYFFLVNAKIAYIGHCDDFATRLRETASIPKARCNVEAHQPICQVNTKLYRAFQRRDMVHCFFYPSENHRLVRDILIDIVRPAWNQPA